MKRIYLLASAIYLSCAIFAAEPIEVNSQINDVTVFLQGAQITRTAVINLPKGSSTLSFSGLPLNIDPQSIQARGEGNFIILSLMHQVNYMTGQRKTTQVKQLEDSLKIYEDQLAWIYGLLEVMKNEEEMLKANRDISSSEKGVVLAELKQAADFYRARLSEIKKEEIRLNREAIKAKEKVERVRNQLNSQNVKLQQPVSEVLVNVSSNQSLTGKIILTYAVYDAGWMPAYDVRVKDIQSPVQMLYNAMVFQNTGESWEKVNIKLSTANPQQRGEKPDLQPWYVDFYQEVYPLNRYNTVKSGAPVAERKMEMMVAEESLEIMDADEMQSSETPAAYTGINENQTNLEFDIRIPYDIPSDNKLYTINIQDITLPASFEYYCAPKLDREAFLLAVVTGWETYNLLSGEMNLFFEGTYVGKSHLDVRNTNDTLNLSLGRDKGIVVTRVKMKDFTEERTIGSNKRETRAWEITIRNTKKQAVELRIEDQLPVSMNKDIEVEPLDYSGGKYNRQTGMITWKQTIDPSAEKKLRISFAIKYPKDQRVFVD
jgi:uncharacterized protein (TIGR02231 family)